MDKDSPRGTPEVDLKRFVRIEKVSNITITTNIIDSFLEANCQKVVFCGA